VAEPPKAYNTYFMSFAYVPMAERGISGDAGAEQRRYCFDRYLIGYMEDKIFVYGDLVRIAAVSRCYAVSFERVISSYISIFAILFQALFAIVALTAGIYEASYGCEIAFFKLCYMAACFGYPAYNFMTWHHGVYGVAPFIARLVNI
jgi:hypothetical protein